PSPSSLSGNANRSSGWTRAKRLRTTRYWAIGRRCLSRTARFDFWRSRGIKSLGSLRRPDAARFPPQLEHQQRIELLRLIAAALVLGDQSLHLGHFEVR